MKSWLIRVLRALLTWLEPAVEASETRADDAVLAVARLLVQAQQSRDASGENKRHQVYAALIKTFPDARKRDLGFAIERVLQEEP